MLESFIEESNRAKSFDELFPLYVERMKHLGFDRVVFSLLTNHAAIGRSACHGIAHNYPDDWMSHYATSGYFEIDPVAKRVRANDKPFTWAELPQWRTLTSQEELVMRGGREAGLHDGIAVALRGCLGALAGVGAASSVQGVVATRDLLCTVNLLSHQFYTAYLALCADDATPKLATLTQTEREILTWTAAGKTKNEIAIILSRSRHTIDYHCRNVFEKLDAPNMMVAVLSAINQGLIEP